NIRPMRFPDPRYGLSIRALIVYSVERVQVMYAMSRTPAERLLSIAPCVSHVPLNADHCGNSGGPSKESESGDAATPWLNQTSSKRPGVQCVTKPTCPVKLTARWSNTEVPLTLTLTEPLPVSNDASNVASNH